MKLVAREGRGIDGINEGDETDTVGRCEGVDEIDDIFSMFDLVIVSIGIKQISW